MRCSSSPSRAPVDGAHVQRLVQRHATCKNQRAQHVRGEAGTLLVGEEAHRQWMLGAHAGLAQRLQHLQPRQHAVVAVVASAGAHRVGVRARHHRRRIGPPAGLHAEDVADGVDGDRQTELAHPAHDQIAPLAVGVGQGQAAAPAAVDGPHLRQGVEPPHQARGVDAQRRDVRHRSAHGARRVRRVGGALEHGSRVHRPALTCSAVRPVISR